MISTEQVVNYLRRIGAFDGSPKRELTTTELVCVDPRGEWDEYYMQYPYWQYRPVDSHKSEFDAINGSLERTDLNRVQEQALREIPNSSSTTIIELGSEYGTKGAGALARYKPHARIILMDKGWEESFLPKYLFNPVLRDKFNHLEVFEKGMELLTEPNLEKKVNGLYKANGIHNLEFHQIELTPQNMASTLRNMEISGDVYLFSYKCPKQLSYTLARVYNHLNAKFMCASLTAQEKIKPFEEFWKSVQRNLRLTDQELRGYIESVYDSEAVRFDEKNPSGPFSFSKKYDYSDSAQRRIGIMLKLGMAMALTKEVNGEVLRNSQDNDNYNQIDHYIIARR